MTAEEQVRGPKVEARNNVYTVIIAVAFFVVLATAAFVAYKCYFQYGTLFSIP